MKKGEIGTVTALIVIMVLIFFAAAYDLVSRKCNSNDDCGDEQYCGSDFKCHSFPTSVQRRGTGLVIPALIMGLSLIISTHIFTKKFSFYREKKESKKEQKDQHDFSDLQH
ncbi:hypothetical protein ACFLZX_05910 [Nanoarchaeota archaeon]